MDVLEWTGHVFCGLTRAAFCCLWKHYHSRLKIPKNAILRRKLSKTIVDGLGQNMNLTHGNVIADSYSTKVLLRKFCLLTARPCEQVFSQENSKTDHSETDHDSRYMPVVVFTEKRAQEWVSRIKIYHVVKTWDVLRPFAGGLCTSSFLVVVLVPLLCASL